jgi:phospholipase C
MGYYTRKDLSFYYALADAFAVCDHYFCSVIGPADPNRLYAVSAWLDPSGTAGGRILSTSTSRVERFGTVSWTTMPEQLQARGISWKVYGSADGNYGDNVLPYFKQYWSNGQLFTNALTPSHPGSFQSDFADDTLPQVSWILAPLIASEHPPTPGIYGETAAADVLNTLVSNPSVWAKTALFITYDENGGRGSDRAGVPRPDAGRLPIQSRRLRLQAHL